jgi:hypothetical protein
MKLLCLVLTIFFIVSCYLGFALADDPLEKIDGTEEWDDGERKKKRIKFEQIDGGRTKQLEKISAEVTAMELAKIVWEYEREGFLAEKEKQERYSQLELSRKKKAAEDKKAKEQVIEQNAEEAEGAAAAAKMLQEAENKKEDSILKKAKLNVDEQGQVVDPELQQETEEE